jgi:CDP-glucose 4,6-dehydratase
MKTNNDPFDSFFLGKRVLVTGHTGFKGSWLTCWLLKMGAKVSGLALAPKFKNGLYTSAELGTRIKSYIGDIRDFKFVNGIIKKEKPEIIIHLAAQAIVFEALQNPYETFDVNIKGSLNILEACKKNSCVRSLVYITSDKCYKNKEWIWGYREIDELGGFDPYSSSKAAAELVFHSYLETYFNHSGLNAASARAGNVIGGGDWSDYRIIPDIVKSIVNKKPLDVRNPLSTRPWQHVLEPLRGYLLLAKLLYEKNNGRQYSGSWNFGPLVENNVNVKTLIDKTLKSWNCKLKVNFGATETGKKESGLLFLSYEKAFHLLNWKPALNIDQTISFTVDWYKKQNENKKSAMLEFTYEQIENYLNVVKNIK